MRQTIHFFSCFHNDPFHSSAAAAIRDIWKAHASRAPDFVALEFDATTSEHMVSQRPRLRFELQREHGYLPPDLLAGFTTSLGWEPDFAKGEWAGSPQIWLERGRPAADDIVAGKLGAIRNLLRQAGVLNTDAHDRMKSKLRAQLRLELEGVRRRDPTFVGFGKPPDDRDERMFDELQNAIASRSGSVDAAVLVGPCHMLDDGSTLLARCPRPKWEIRDYWQNYE